MLFHTLTFLVFLPLVFFAYWARASRGWQNGVTLVASFVFYSWWDWRFLFLMLASALIDYVAGVLMDQRAMPLRRTILIIALTANLLILGFYKYFNFFVDSLVVALSGVGIDLPTSTLAIVLPVGISFYTFQSMSYSIDIYRGHFQPQRSVVDYLAFVTFFPQLVAGPIERATHLLPQFREARTFRYDEAKWGLRLMLWGFAKKMLVADNVAPFVNGSFAAVDATSGAGLVLATILFSFQIYCDFSAYSDIAAGTAALFGIKLMRNFAYPYFSQTVTEFWRRWHISLSSWLRDYVYHPLGGNRVSRMRCYRNLMVVCLASGFWHGAAWTFIAWGFLHGLFLVIERALGRNRLASESSDVPLSATGVSLARKIARVLATFFLVTFSWVFFRAESLESAITVFRRMFFDFGGATEIAFLLRTQFTALFLVVALVFIEWLGRNDWNPLRWERMPLVPRWVGYSALGWIILLFGTNRVEEFIYFRF